MSQLNISKWIPHPRLSRISQDNREVTHSHTSSPSAENKASYLIIPTRWLQTSVYLQSTSLPWATWSGGKGDTTSKMHVIVACIILTNWGCGKIQESNKLMRWWVHNFCWMLMFKTVLKRTIFRRILWTAEYTQTNSKSQISYSGQCFCRFWPTSK